MTDIHLSMNDLNQIVIFEMSRGKSRDDMVAFLHERGWPEDAARKFISNATSQHTYKVQSVQEAAREAEQEDPFVIDVDRQKQQFAWLAAAIGLWMITWMITMSVIGALIHVGR